MRVSERGRVIVTVVWIGEVPKPDTFSSIIQFTLSLRMIESLWERIKYTVKFCFGYAGYLFPASHNAIFMDDEICWHGTISEDEQFSGFCKDTVAHALEGSVVRFCQEVETRFTPEGLAGYLEAREFTPYGLIRNNIVNLHPWLLHQPIFGKNFWRTGKGEINCSEVAAEITNGGTIISTGEIISFDDLDTVSPLVSFTVLKPKLCDHKHSKQQT